MSSFDEGDHSRDSAGRFSHKYRGEANVTLGAGSGGVDLLGIASSFPVSEHADYWRPEFHEYGIDNPDDWIRSDFLALEAAEWEHHQFTPDEASQWRDAFDHMRQTVDAGDAANWSELGFTPTGAAEWGQVPTVTATNPLEAARLRREGHSPREAFDAVREQYERANMWWSWGDYRPYR